MKFQPPPRFPDEVTQAEALKIAEHFKRMSEAARMSGKGMGRVGIGLHASIEDFNRKMAELQDSLVRVELEQQERELEEGIAYVKRSLGYQEPA